MRYWIIGSLSVMVLAGLIGSLSLSLIATPTTVFAQEAQPTLEPFIQTDFKVLSGDVQRPNGLFWYDGFLYTGCAGDWTLYRIQAETGETATYIFGIKNVHTLYVEDGPNNHATVWAADFQSNQVVRVHADTGLIPVKAGLANPWGITPSATDDGFYITQWGTDDIIKMTRDGQVTVLASDFNDPSGIAVTEDTIYVGNHASARRAVEWLDMSDGALPFEPKPLVTGLQKVTNVVLGPDGLLYIAYALGTRGVVGRIDPELCKESGCTNTQVELVIWTELAAPLAGLTISPDMKLYVHTMYGSEIYWLQLPAPEETAAS